MDYNFNEIEPKWRIYWQKNNTYKTEIDTHKPKYYVLDMFPYPSGAGLHVGHPLGYIASDIYSRYKRLKGFNVLHPMGYDAYGLPAEQYAIQTGQHPAITTEQNIKRYREQLDKIGFSFDWDREVRTSDPEYYKWTQWTFIQIFNSYYCYDEQKARPIAELIAVFSQQGSQNLNIACSEPLSFTAQEWNAKSEKEQQEILMNYRLAYLADIPVNWCPALGTVLANDEVVNGVSVRGGHPVERKLMRQWSLRITAYAERLLQGLENVEWTDSLKEIQRNWIGRSEGATMYFHLSLTPSKGGGTQTPGYHTTDKLSWHSNIDNAREMRKNPTEAESLLWKMLRKKNLGYRFRKQHLIDNFIVDFVCLEKKLVIEVDGGYHESPEQKEYDEQRTICLNELGYHTLRFKNEEITAESEQVLSKIKAYCDAADNTQGGSNLPSFGGGQGEVEIFTTRPDTIFGVTFMVVCPEHELIDELTTPEQKQAVTEYVAWAKNRSERERQSEVKKVSGVFTGSYAMHPFTGKQIPIWVSEYVLAGYGSGAIMAVPAHDSRDFAFARHFNLPIVQVVVPTGEQAEDTSTWTESKDSKEGTCINSDFIDGMEVKKAITAVINRLEEEGIGTRKINYRLRDAIFSRQRYWGEPFPIYYKDNMPYALPESELPLLLPEVDKYLPTESGEPPLARAKNWQTKDGYPLETSTMPGFAGSSAYYFRYMDPRNQQALVSTETVNYWQNVDLYVGGAEHATGHLLYARFWNKFLFDLGLCPKDEPFQKLINQGMIQGRSNFVYRIKGTNKYVSLNLKNEYETDALHVDINIVDNDILDIEQFKKWMPEFANAEFVLEDGKYICGHEVEKMSKSLYNVQNPDDLIEKYGADTLRLYEMFLGPIEQAKPWDTKGIEGVARFIRKFWKLYHDADNNFTVSDAEPTPEELKVLHKTIKKIQQDIEGFSFNTSVSAFMICVNELGDLKCNKRSILEPLCILLSSFAPHISEELWQLLGHDTSITFAIFPEYDESVLIESSHTYPVSFNGKVRFNINLPANITAADAEKTVLANADTQKWLEGKAPKKIIFVPKKIVNVVI